jgi:hypothetical protein
MAPAPAPPVVNDPNSQTKNGIVNDFLDYNEGVGIADNGDGFTPGGEFSAYETTGDAWGDIKEHAGPLAEFGVKAALTGGLSAIKTGGQAMWDQLTGTGFQDPNAGATITLIDPKTGLNVGLPGKGSGYSYGESDAGGFSEGNEAVGDYGGWGDLI